jgi:hypothetical protein
MKCSNCNYEHEGPPVIRIGNDDGTQSDYCSQKCVWEHRFPDPRKDRLSLREFRNGGWQ